MKSGKNSIKHRDNTQPKLSSLSLTYGRLLLAKASNHLIRTITRCLQRSQKNWHAILLPQKPRQFRWPTEVQRYASKEYRRTSCLSLIT